MQKIIDNSDSKILFFEIPLLLENGLERGLDLVVNVSVKKENQIQRLRNRDGISKEKALKKISAQMPAEEKQKKADVNIFNNNGFDELYSQLEKFRESLNDFPLKKICRMIDI